MLEHEDTQLQNVYTAHEELRHALTLILFHTRCRCELRDETLVILPLDAPDGEESRQ